MVSDIRKFKIYTLNNDFIKETDMLPSKFTGMANYYDETYVFYKNGLVHREDGPAIEHKNVIFMFKEHKNGAKEYYNNGKLHRIDGPAIENLHGISEYWVNGVHYTKEQHDLLYSTIKLKKLI